VELETTVSVNGSAEAEARAPATVDAIELNIRCTSIVPQDKVSERIGKMESEVEGEAVV